MRTLALSQAVAATVSLLLLAVIGYEAPALSAAALTGLLAAASLTIQKIRGSD